MDLEPLSSVAVAESERASAAEGAVATADLAECTCPDFCERDHDNE
ncbi:MAG TPA: hypothetical protein VMJ49_03665 [Gaiellaceae bacterium]|nr:hypothetical protein [Gaiellaceae bacterium]